MTKRVIVFIDAQNFYRVARRAFDTGGSASYRVGQFEPSALAERLAARAPDRSLVETRVYTGKPDPFLQPKGHAANVAQCETWQQAGCTVVHRPLRYLSSWPEARRLRKKASTF